MSINEMIRHTQASGISVTYMIYGNSLIHKARNEAIAHVDPAATHVLFIDDDMAPFPNALVNLLNADKPVITALCTTRGFGTARIAAKVYDAQNDVFGSIEHVNRERIITGPFAPGTAFLLMQKPVIDALIEYNLSGQDWLDENSTVLSRMSVRSEKREAQRQYLETLRRKRYELTRRVRVFHFPMNDQDEELGEDIALGRKLLRLGIEVAIDGTTPVGHLGEYPYGPWDVNKEEVA